MCWEIEDIEAPEHRVDRIDIEAYAFAKPYTSENGDDLLTNLKEMGRTPAPWPVYGNISPSPKPSSPNQNQPQPASFPTGNQAQTPGPTSGAEKTAVPL
jgi:hypothetical protein